MITYPISGDGVPVKAFEIENVYIGLKQISELLKSVSGVSDVRMRKLFSGNSDIHIEFKYLDTDCVVWEPYGDSSRYWIGPKDDKNTVIDMKNIQSAFDSYQPPIFKKLLGDLLTLKFVSRTK